MTATEINKIVETIAGAMGDEITRIDGIPYFQGHVFNPYTSKDDVFDAVDVICGRPYVLYINQTKVDCLAELRPISKILDEYQGNAETPSAAVAVALVEFIKEK